MHEKINHEKINAVIKEYCTLLKEVFAENLLALVLYGSAAGETYNPSVSDINVLVILEKSSAEILFRFSKAAKTIMRKNRISPIIMTGEEFLTASDVFPLEYCDILEKHFIVYGSSDILSITVSRENLRLELEEKLRGAVADIRNMLLTAGGDNKFLGKLLLRWSALGGVLFRGLLRLKGKNVSGLNAEDIITEVEKEYGVSLESFSALNFLRQGKKPASFTAANIADILLESLKSLVRTVDSMEEKKT